MFAARRINRNHVTLLEILQDLRASGRQHDHSFPNILGNCSVMPVLDVLLNVCNAAALAEANPAPGIRRGDRPLSTELGLGCCLKRWENSECRLIYPACPNLILTFENGKEIYFDGVSADMFPTYHVAL